MYRLGAAGFDHMKEMIETLTRSGLALLRSEKACASGRPGKHSQHFALPTLGATVTSIVDCMLCGMRGVVESLLNVQSTVHVVMVHHRSGLGAMELFAMGLKATGSYLSRTLSYKGADFDIAKLDIAPEFG